MSIRESVTVHICQGCGKIVKEVKTVDGKRLCEDCLSKVKEDE